MDIVPMPQKILLGMDFVIEHGLCIDAPNDTICITTPKSSASLDNLPLMALESITLHPLASPSSLSITYIWLHLTRCVRVTACWRSGMTNQRFGRTYHRQQHHTIG